MTPELIKKIEQLTQNDGCNRTFLKHVTLYQAQKPYPRMPLIYDQCLCFVAQGHKIGHLSDKTLIYDKQNYLVVPTIVPFECETDGTPENPFYAITISIDYVVIQQIMEQVGERYSKASENLAPQPGAYLEKTTPQIIDPLLRLLSCLQTEGEAEILGKQILREIYYRVLLSNNGHILASAARGESAYARISQILKLIHENFDGPLDVTKMAEMANMSVRSFHNHFKTATTYTPVQYLKRIRLEKARQYIVTQGLQASVTAHMVGYESPSQFSREFKRHFGYPPREAKYNDLNHVIQ